MCDLPGQAITYFDTPTELMEAIGRKVLSTEIVLDVGPGIYPSNFFVPKFQILIEPWLEYVNILQKRFENQKDVIIFHSDGLGLLKKFSDQSVDSIFLLDVIEHLGKEEGLQLIEEMKRVSRQQIVIFTPLGFMPQHRENDNKDRWGLHGGEYQEHKSGWEPSDFSVEWEFYICEKFHEVDEFEEKLDEPFGAFYAVFNQRTLKQSSGKPYEGSFFKETPKDAEISRLSELLRKANNEIHENVTDIERLKHENVTDIARLKLEIETIYNSTSWTVTKPIRYAKKIWLSLLASKN